MIKALIITSNILFSILFKNKKFLFSTVMFFLLTSLWLVAVNFYFFQNTYYYNFFCNNYKNHHVIKKFNSFELSILFSCFWSVLLCSHLSLKAKKKTNNIVTFTYLFILACLLLLTTCSNLLLFFFIYELFLFASAFLVLHSSHNKRSKKVTVYFLLWTQLGSFLLFLSILFLILKLSVVNFNDFFYLKYNTLVIKILSVIIFFSFGIKTPVWPFHFWLTKTHVESNTGFSIFLSGTLVKISLLGFYKFYFFFFLKNYFFIFIVFLGLLDATIKIFFQKDLKKIVAFSTIFEMNQILLLMFCAPISGLFVLNYFILFHTFISSAFFFCVDTIYSNYKSRNIQLIKGISEINFIFSCFFVIFILLFIGLPLTPKFFIELYLFSRLFEINIILFIFTFIIFFTFYIIFLKIFLSLFFGFSKKKIMFFTLKKSNLFIYLYILLSIVILILL